MKILCKSIILVTTLTLLYGNASASKFQQLLPVTDKILMLHFDDGCVEHYGLGQAGNDDRVVKSELLLIWAMRTASYTLSSADDANYATPRSPLKVGRKSKAKDFSSNHASNYPSVLEHFIYLELPHPLQHGKTYHLQFPYLDFTRSDTTFVFDEYALRSETIHVNQIGYAPAAPAKYAYLSHWLGDLGPLSLDDYAASRFYIVEEKSRTVVYTGTIELRKRLQSGGADNGYPTHAPFGSFTGADVWVADFSDFIRPGEYRLMVGRIGSSHPFRVDDDVYREAFYTTIRALYLQRCGVALEAPYTQWTRPRCHHPAQGDTVILSNWRYLDGGNAFTQLPQYATNIKKPFWGGWHDAADWDRNAYHLNACKTLLLAYELRPENFSDDELNIPESGNGIPDILDEARWGVDFFKRMQEEDGGIHGGIETWRHPATGVSCVTDTDQWYAYAPDPQVSFHYAAVACQMAHCLEVAGHGKFKSDYLASARRAYGWAMNHILPGDETKVRDFRQYAAAWLFRLTGEAAFQEQFKKDSLIKTAASELEVWDSYDQQWAVWTYVMTKQPNIDQSLKNMLSQAVERWAYSDHINSADSRGYRYGNDWWYPVVSGNATRPNIFPLMAAYAITGNKKYPSYCYTTCDYILGANPLNMCWVSGIGEKHPEEFMHLDSWYYNREKGMIPGIIPYGPYWYEAVTPAGPWEPQWGRTTAYPDAKLWPSHELWFENRYCPPTNEFTVHESIATAAAAFGFLSKPGGKFTGVTQRKTEPVGDFRLLQNYPNPFLRGANSRTAGNPATTIAFHLPAAGRVEVIIFDLSGRQVVTLLEAVRSAGAHTVAWEGKDANGHALASGVYFAVVKFQTQMLSRKMLLVR